MSEAAAKPAPSKSAPTSRTMNSRRNVLTGALRSAVTLLASFVVRTVLIRTFGVEYAGLSGLFSSVLQVLNLAELGLGTAVVYALYQPVAVRDDQTVCAYLWYFRRAYRIIGAVVLAAGVAVTPLLPHLIEGGQVPGSLNLAACWLIVLSDVVSGYMTCGYLGCIPEAHQRNDVLRSIDIIVTLMRCAMQIGMLCLGQYYGYLLAFPVMSLLWNVIAFAWIRHLFPQYACRGRLDETQQHDLRRNVYGLFLRRVFTVLRNGIDVACISAFVGLALAGTYNNYLIVFNGLVSVTSMALGAIIPSVGNSVVTETVQKNHGDWRRFDFAYMTFAGFATTCLLCLWQPFMRLWLGDDLLLSWPEVCGLIAYYYILKSGDMWSVFGEAIGLWWDLRRLAVAESVANVVLNIVLCRHFGIAGVIAASIISLTLFSFLSCPRILWRRYFQEWDVREFFVAHGLWAAASVPGAVACVVLCAAVPDGNGLFGLVLRGVVCAGVYPVVWWLIWHRTGEWADLMGWVSRSGLLRFGSTNDGDAR